MLRDTHIKINIDHLENNITSIRDYCKGTRVGAVLKSNAYGHGSKYMAKALYDMGITTFLVATLLEAMELKNENDDYNVIIMGHTPDKYLNQVIDKKITQTVFTYDQAKLLNDLAEQPVKVHVKIETGFNRLGMQITEDTASTIKKIADLDKIIIEGAFTHLSLENRASDLKQFNKFMDLMNEVEKMGVKIPIKHVCDSISMVLHPDFHLDMVRVGALLYGLESEEKGVLDIKPILSFHTKPSHIKTIKKGETISYGNRWIAGEDSIIATLPFGYSDGYPRNMYGKGQVQIKGKFYPIIGVICMDQCMAHVDKDVTLDDEVDIINENMTVSDIAAMAETNKNEVVSRFTPRVPRVYIKNKQIIYVENGLIK
ncbi:alanine racemase [Acidaminobacter sp. JC074]|uniref:alanine racemase n=1 Tax=Acidaminobacter sp. JC074 TaxID=2530199 RepID=UPI001F0D5DA2|nr:alanine racemase [Acidaminobacter sp. JC074]MCH4887459.1 alanine racemase [Acidaminobacter sp. JC074]